MGNTKDADRALATYRVPFKDLYLVGTFDFGVTVLSQQTRALNLVWALVETGALVKRPPDGVTATPKEVGIIGAGFAGLTVAAGLLSKGLDANITIFEMRDTLLPLQHGSDTRWLHPHIYDWPFEGSEGNSAELPVLNWTAARASDVAVQVMTEWRRVVEAWPDNEPRLFCNTRHLHVDEAGAPLGGMQVEWVGEERRPEDGTIDRQTRGEAVGDTKRFDLVIVAAGFGLEKDSALSYWRNDTLGQPNLEQPRRTYLVSGQGDGAMVDLLRLRISSYRQDRILGELFPPTRTALLAAIGDLYKKHERNGAPHLFQGLECLKETCAADFDEVLDALGHRLRRDTDVVLHLRVRKLSDLFERSTSRISFQNKLLVYLLYKCGGVVPSTVPEADLMCQYSIAEDRVVRRHGTERDKNLNSMFSNALSTAVKERRGDAVPDPFSQTDQIEFPFGYFGYSGSTSDLQGGADDEVRSRWRKEYLPGPTALVATTLCATLAGMLRLGHDPDKRLRVTLHRALSFGDDRVLQQCCGYFGAHVGVGSERSAGRTFPADNATIGLAYRTRRIVRSTLGVSPEDLQAAMALLSLNAASRKMSTEVRFLLAIPILSGASGHVAGVIYVDSKSDTFFVDDDCLGRLVAIIDDLLSGLAGTSPELLERIRNVPSSRSSGETEPLDRAPESVRHALTCIEAVDPPRIGMAFRFNFEYSDFIPVSVEAPIADALGVAP